jgi:hypothetical protein
MNLKEKHPTGMSRSRWKQQVKKDVTQKKGRSLEEVDEKLWKES